MDRDIFCAFLSFFTVLQGVKAVGFQLVYYNHGYKTASAKVDIASEAILLQKMQST